MQAQLQACNEAIAEEDLWDSFSLATLSRSITCIWEVAHIVQVQMLQSGASAHIQALVFGVDPWLSLRAQGLLSSNVDTMGSQSTSALPQPPGSMPRLQSQAAAGWQYLSVISQGWSREPC